MKAAEMGSSMSISVTGVGVAPTRATRVPPLVVTHRLAPDIEHAVDRTRAAEHPAVRPFDRAPTEFRLRPVMPDRLIDQQLSDAEGDFELEAVRRPARLDQQDANVRSLAQPIRDCASGGTCAHDDIIVCVFHAWWPSL